MKGSESELLAVLSHEFYRATACDNKRTIKTGRTFTQASFKNNITKREDIIALLGKYARLHVAHLCRFIEVVSPHIGESYYNELYISCTTPILRKICGCEKSVSNLIERGIKIDLLRCTNTKYTFGGGKKKNKSKAYIVNREVASMLQELYVQYNITVSEYQKSSSSLNNISSPASSSISCNPQNVRFRSSLRIPKEVTNNEIISVLLSRYSRLQHYMDLAQKINAKHYAKNERLCVLFNPSIHRSQSGIVTKIGIRASNAICGLPKHADEMHPYQTRGDFFSEYFGGAPVYEYDIKSSIYRVAYLLKSGEWLGEEVDFYSLMCLREHKTKQEREEYKKLAMLLYFGGSVKNITARIIARCPHLLEKYSKESINATVKAAQEKMTAEIGRSMNTEIFLHESCLYMDLLQNLLSRGLKVVQIYDGFYSDDPRLPDLCRELLPCLARTYVGVATTD